MKVELGCPDRHWRMLCASHAALTTMLAETLGVRCADCGYTVATLKHYPLEA